MSYSEEFWGFCLLEFGGWISNQIIENNRNKINSEQCQLQEIQEVEQEV